MTKEALEASIRHWEENVAAETPYDASTSGRECALCGLYYDRDCKGCPVFERTGYECCELTPYENAALGSKRTKATECRRSEDFRE